MYHVKFINYKINQNKCIMFERHVKARFYFILHKFIRLHNLWGTISKHKLNITSNSFSSVQSLSRVQLFATPWTTSCQASLSITNSWSLLKLMSVELVIHPIISSSVFPFSPCLQSFPALGSFQMSKFCTSGGQSIGVSASASVLPMNIQEWFLLGWTFLISLQSKRLSRLSNTTVQKHQFFSSQFSSHSNSHIHTWPLEKP